MRSIHDVIRAARPHLRDGPSLAPLFEDEALLARFSERLLVFARTGAFEQPAPHFSAEVTPPLAEVFEPFRSSVAAWHDTSDSPDVPALFADVMDTSGVRNVLILLGQRLTPASLSDPSAFPPSHQKLLASAMARYTPTDPLSVAGRALAKHAGRGSAFWGEVTGTTPEKNDSALRALERILENPTWWNVFGHPKHVTVFEARVPSGHGARWGHGGGEFVGFLEPFEE